MEEDELSKYVGTMPNYVFQEENKSSNTINILPSPFPRDYDPGMLATIPPNSKFGVRTDESGKIIGTIPILHNNGDPGFSIPYTGPNYDPGFLIPSTGPHYDPGMDVPYTYPSIHDRLIRIDESGKIIGTIPILHNNGDPGFLIPSTGPHYDPGFLIPSTGPHYDPGMDVPYTYPFTHDRFIRIDGTDKFTDDIIKIPFDPSDEDDKSGLSVPPKFVFDDDNEKVSTLLPKNNARFITIETEDGPKTVPYGHNPTRSNLVDYVRIDPKTGEMKHYKKVEYLYEGYYDPETKQYIENPKSEYVENNFHETLYQNNTLIGALKNISVDDIDLELIKNGNWPAKYESLLSDVQSIIDFFEGTDSMFSDINGELGNSLLDNFNISKEELENIKKYVSNNLSAVTELLEQLKQKIIEAEKIEEEKEAKELKKQSLLSNQPREYNPCTHKDAEGKTLHPSGDRNSEYVVWQNNLNTITAEIAELENDLIENKKEQESYLQRIRELNNTTIV